MSSLNYLLEKKVRNGQTKKTLMTKPSAPKKITWIIGLSAGILGIIGHYVDVQVLTEYNYALLLVGFVALALGTTFREL